MHIFQLKLYKLECLFDLSLSGDVYLCNEGGCGLRRSTPYIKVCIIIRQLLFLRENGQKNIFLNDSEKSKIVKKNLSEGCSTLEIAMLLGCGHRTIKVLLQILNRIARNVLRKKEAN